MLQCDLCDKIGNQVACQASHLILDRQFLFFQSQELDVVENAFGTHFADSAIQNRMFDTQAFQAFT